MTARNTAAKPRTRVSNRRTRRRWTGFTQDPKWTSHPECGRMWRVILEVARNDAAMAPHAKRLSPMALHSAFDRLRALWCVWTWTGKAPGGFAEFGPDQTAEAMPSSKRTATAAFTVLAGGGLLECDPENPKKYRPRQQVIWPCAHEVVSQYGNYLEAHGEFPPGDWWDKLSSESASKVLNDEVLVLNEVKNANPRSGSGDSAKGLGQFVTTPSHPFSDGIGPSGPPPSENRSVEDCSFCGQTWTLDDLKGPPGGRLCPDCQQ